jgi:hypothetical protein
MAFMVASLFVPGAVRSDIYKWTDEQGGTVISNILPENPDKAKNVERVVKESKPAVQASRPAATPTEQMLLDRIDNLERRLQARTYVPPAPQSAAPAEYYPDSGYYYYPPAPPPPPAHYANYAPVYYARPAYAYPLAPAYSYIAYPRTFVARTTPVRVQHGAFRGGATHRHWR